VFDAASRVEGISGTIEIIRAGTVGNQLHVSDMIEIQNRSTPPLTQAGEHSFDVYLPPHARISSVLAAGPGNVAMIIPATPRDDSGHYSVSFPLQPGATKFAFNYDTPYDGRAAFHLRHAYALQQVAVMIPPTMQFSSASTAFKTLETGNRNYHVRAIAQLKAGPGPEFEISGSGSLPPVRPGANAETQPMTAAPVPPVQNSPAPGVSSPPASVQSPPPSLGSTAAQTGRSYAPSWMILAILGIGLAATSAAAIRVGAAKRTSAPQIAGINGIRPNQTRHNETEAPLALLEGLKDELFQLEAAKVRGTISTEEYTLSKSALEETVKRALRRASCEMR
jgi:hypothetical protein